jgi:hypothetical protein
VAEQVVALHEVAIAQATGDGVEDTGAAGHRLEAEAVAVEQVVGGDVVQLSDAVAALAEDTPDHEVDDDAPDVAQEFADAHELARLVGLFDDGVAAVDLQGRPGGGPDEVGAADANVPEVAQALGDALAHLAEDLPVPAVACALGPPLADQPDGGGQGG